MPNDRDEKRDGQLRKLNALITRNEEELAYFLSEQAKEIYEKLRENQAEYGCLCECEAFCIGFRLGARITYKVMDGLPLIAREAGSFVNAETIPKIV